jgi:hypothetical protein
LNAGYGKPVSYEVLGRAPPNTAPTDEIGTVYQVLADESSGIFDGVVIAQEHPRRGHCFADADDIERIYKRDELAAHSSAHRIGVRRRAARAHTGMNRSAFPPLAR